MKFSDAFRREIASQLEQLANVAESHAKAIAEDAMDSVEAAIEKFGDSPNAEEMIGAAVDGALHRAAQRGYDLSREVRATSFRLIVGAIRIARVVLIGG